MQQLVTQAEYARHRGVSREAIRKAVATGKIPVHEERGKKLIDVAEADLKLGANVTRILADVADDFDQAPDKPSAATTGLTAARTEREQYAARLAELELNQRLGKVRSVEEFTLATQRCAEIGIRSIDRIGGRADELAAMVAKDGVLGARSALRLIARDLRTTMADAFTKLAAGDLAADNDDAGEGELG